MSPDAAALAVLRAGKWKKDGLAADAVQFIETGDAGALARLRQDGTRPRWWREVLDALAGSFLWGDEEGLARPFQVLAGLIAADDLRAWVKKAKLGPFDQARVCREFMRWDEAAFQDVALQAARRLLDSTEGYGPDWIVETFGRDVLPNVIAGLERGAKQGQFGCALRWDLLGATVQALGKEALPAVLCAFRDPWLRCKATGHLLDLDPRGHAGLIQQGIDEGLKENDPSDVCEHLELAKRWGLDATAERIWPLLEHTSKRVREAAAQTLAGLGKAALPPAAEALRHRKADVRLAAVWLLAAVDSPAAREMLRPLANKDGSGPVRDAVRKLLKEGSAGGRSAPRREEILARARKALEKVKDKPPAWVKEHVKALRYADGEPVELEAVRYLIHRQGKAKKGEPDIEVQALCHLIDRRTSGDFALALVNRYLRSESHLLDRWQLVLACLLGDDRVVPLLHGHVRKLAEGPQAKRAEDSIRALALLGSDAALMTLDALAARYRSKRAYLGQTAAEAFARAAQQLGLTPDELGDRVVPWLGFEPGKPRVIDCGQRRVEARIGLNFKLTFFDPEAGKPLKALPAGAPAALQAEVKEQTAVLKETVKAQLARLENLMVRQRRWPADRWRELFLGHPLLLPFAVRLVWGAYDESGRLAGTFRALEDRSLTGADDSVVSLEAGGSVSVVHPLELDAGTRQAWERHLADYEIEPPFEQLGRPVALVPAGQKDKKFAPDYEGVEVLVGTFRNRAEKLGWARGGMSSSGFLVYWKRFPAAGLDALVGLEGLDVGSGWEDQITLGPVCFVRHGSEAAGGYDFLPGEHEAGVVPLGKVPAVVYSEALGDLQKVAGRKADA
jgi:hypothetical protein